MSREERRDNKLQTEKELLRLNREINKRERLGRSWSRHWKEEEDSSFTWEAYPEPVFVGYVKNLVPAHQYREDPLVQLLAEKYTQQAFSRDKRFLKKDKKTRKLVDLVPRVLTVTTKDPLVLDVPNALIPYFECTQKLFDPRLQHDVWYFSPMEKFFEVKKSKLYHTHHRVLNGKHFREMDDLEERFETLGGWRKASKAFGQSYSYHDRDDTMVKYKVLKKDFYTH